MMTKMVHEVGGCSFCWTRAIAFVWGESVRAALSAPPKIPYIHRRTMKMSHGVGVFLLSLRHSAFLFVFAGVCLMAGRIGRRAHLVVVIIYSHLRPS